MGQRWPSWKFDGHVFCLGITGDKDEKFWGGSFMIPTMFYED